VRVRERKKGGAGRGGRRELEEIANRIRISHSMSTNTRGVQMHETIASVLHEAFRQEEMGAQVKRGPVIKIVLLLGSME
jgi:hypothetical protein